MQKEKRIIFHKKTKVHVSGIQIIGREDYCNQNRKALIDFTRHINKERPVFLMDHQPSELDIAEAQGIDLVVSGHTHKGQIAPGSLITGELFENDWGYLKKGNLHSIVTSGFGFWGPPIRIGTQSELDVIDVHFSGK